MENTQPAGAGAEAIAPAAPVATEAQENQAAPEQENKPASDPKDEELAKLRKALDRKNRDIGKRTAQYHQAKQELEQERQRLQQYQPKESTQASDSPQEKDFANYGDYLKAVARHEARQELLQGQKKAQEQKQEVEKASWKQEREEHLRDNAAKARESIPDFQKVLEDNQHLLAEFPPHVVDAFLDTDEPAFAFHQMVLDGSIDQLLQAPNAHRAAALIAKAEMKATAPKTKPVSQAPAPMAPTKGTAQRSKTLAEMTPRELVHGWLSEDS